MGYFPACSQTLHIRCLQYEMFALVSNKCTRPGNKARVLVSLRYQGSLFVLYHTEFYSSETGLQQALNATAVLFGDKTALSKLSGRCVVMSPVHSLLRSFSCGEKLGRSPRMRLRVNSSLSPFLQGGSWSSCSKMHPLQSFHCSCWHQEN